MNAPRKRYPSDDKPRARKRGAGQITVSLGDMKPVLDKMARDAGQTPSQVLRGMIQENHRAPLDGNRPA